MKIDRCGRPRKNNISFSIGGMAKAVATRQRVIEESQNSALSDMV